MSPRRACLPAGALGLVCALAAGCGGSSNLLAPNDAAELKSALTQVRAAVDARDCQTAEIKLRRLKGIVGRLPGSVDRGLRTDLREEVDGKLRPQAVAECGTSLTQAVPTVSVPAPSPSPSTPPPSTPAPSTPSTTTATTPSVPSTPSTPSTSTPATPSTSTPAPPGASPPGTANGTGGASPDVVP